MGAPLDDAPPVQDDDLVGPGDGVQPVGDASLSRASWMRVSDSGSVAEVASSRMRIGASARIDRAMHTRWAWPPDRRASWPITES